MKNLRSLVCGLGILFVLVGCTSTGGTIGGLIPAPKFTKGKLSDGLYTAQDDSFSVRTPFDTDSYEYTYMAIAESYGNREDDIQFSSSAAPAEVYRIAILKDVPPDQDIEKLAFDEYRKLFEGAYKTPFKNHRTKQIMVSNVPVILNTYSQHIPERSSLGRTAMALDVLHSCFYLAKGKNAAYVCINRIAPGTEGASVDAEQRIEKFIGSFELK